MNNVLSIKEVFEVSLNFKTDYKRLSPILKWAGGKEQELKYILPNLPPAFSNYYEPFVGGGAVYTSLKCSKYFINDKSEELFNLYTSIYGVKRDAFFQAVEEIIHNWDLLTKVAEKNSVFFVDTYKKYSANILSEEEIKQTLLAFIADNSEQFNGMFSATFNFNPLNFIKELEINIVRKIKRMKQLELLHGTLPDGDIVSNMETAMKSAFYMYFRHIYNHHENYRIKEPIRSAIFLYIRNFAYSGMFRYNANGHFNVPYGGIGYNRKNFQRKLSYLKSPELHELLKATVIENLDFEDFFKKHPPTSRDFIFLDPPYDSEFSTYANNEFTRDDQARLADYLVNNCRGKWMLVIKNTDLIRRLYCNSGLNIKQFDKKYLVSFMNRNDKNTEHLLITNY